MLTEVQMDTVRLSSALLISSQMQRVNGAAADLRAANLNKAILSEASLIGSDLRGANLSKTILNGATLSNANLIKADFAGAQLDGTVFRHETKATLAPIFEDTQNGGRSIIGGYFLEDLGVYLVGDFLGSIRLLRETESNRWEEIYHQRMSNQILSFGYQPKTKMLFMAGWNETYTVHIEPHLVPLLPTATFCNTTMPDGSVNNIHCP